MINELRFVPVIHFLEKIRKEGFDTDVHTHQQVIQVLKNLPPDNSPEQIKTLIAPIIAKSEEEQIRFYECFDRHANILLKVYSNQFLSVKESPGQILKEQKKDLKAFHKTTESKGEKQDFEPRKSVFLQTKNLITAGTLIIVIFLLGFPIYQNLSAPDTPENKPVLSQSDIEKQKEQTTLSSEKDNFPTSLDDRISEAVKPKTEANYFRDTTRKLTFAPVEVGNLEALSNRLDNQVSYQFYRNQSNIKYGIILLILAIFLAKQLRNQKTVQDLRKVKLNHDSPGKIKLNIPKSQKIDFSNEFYSVVKKLNIRQETARKKLNIPATVAATVEKGGQWDFRFSKDDELVEYLFLIDLPSEENHSANLFNRIFRVFRENDLHAERFYFNGNPEKCWNEQYKEGILLSDIQQLFKHHYVLVFSNGDGLLANHLGQYDDVWSVFEGWEKRALLTPRHFSDWGKEENELAELFRLFPASLDGFTNLITNFEEENRGKTIIQNFKSDTHHEPIKIDEFQVFSSLEAHFSPEMQAWISACAVYPELNWELTLRLGHLLSEDLPETLVTHANLYDLSQLEWFQKGEIPTEIRSVLLISRHFTIDTERKVRREICRILENSSAPEPEDSLAEEKRQMLLAVNQLILDKNDASALRMYRRQVRKNIPQDVVSITRLNKQADILNDWMPSKLRKMIYLDENPLMGTRMWVRFAGILLLCLIIQGFTINQLEFDNNIEAAGMTYSLDGQSNKEIFYRHFHKYEFNQGLKDYENNRFFKAAEHFGRALSYEKYAHEAFDPKANQPKNQVYKEALGACYLYRNQYENAVVITKDIRRDRGSYFNQKMRNLDLFLQYDFVGFEIENHIRVRKNGKYGLLHTSRHLSVPIEYDYLSNFYKGRCLAVKGNEIFLLNHEGNRLENVTSISTYSENGLKGFLVNGNIKITAPIYEEISDLTNGFYRVKKNGKYGFVDQFTELVIPNIYENAKKFNENRVAQVSKNGFTYFIDPKNECIAECPDSEAFESKIAANNYRAYKDKNGFYGYKNRDGILKITPQFLEAWNFGIAQSGRVRTPEGWGLIDKFGKPLSNFDFEKIESFSNGTYLAQKNGKKGFLNEFGEEITPFIYDFALPFESEMTVVRIGAKYGVINQYGIPVIKVVFDDIKLYGSKAVLSFEGEQRTLDLEEI